MKQETSREKAATGRAKHFKDWSLENSKMIAKKNMVAAFLTDSVPKESPARLIIDLNDAKVMILSLDEVYLANKLSNLLPYVIKHAELKADNKSDVPALTKVTDLDKLKSDFMVIASKADHLPTETVQESKIRISEKSVKLWDYLSNLASVKLHSSNSSLINDFFNKFLRDGLGCPINDLNLIDLRNNFNQFLTLNINSVNNVPTVPKRNQEI